MYNAGDIYVVWYLLTQQICVDIVSLKTVVRPSWRGRIIAYNLSTHKCDYILSHNRQNCTSTPHTFAMHQYGVFAGLLAFY